jgi:hypothetical protein
MTKSHPLLTLSLKRRTLSMTDVTARQWGGRKHTELVMLLREVRRNLCSPLGTSAMLHYNAIAYVLRKTLVLTRVWRARETTGVNLG